MDIYDISVKYFRGIEILPSLNCGSLNSYVGKNDAGKSNILKALDAFFNDTFTTNDINKNMPAGEVTEIKIRFTPRFTMHPLSLDLDGKLSLIKRFSINHTGKVKKEMFYECNDILSDDIGDCFSANEAGLNSMLRSAGIDFSRSGRGVTNISKIESLSDDCGIDEREINIYPAADFLKNLAKYYDDFAIPTYLLFDAEQDLNVGSTDFQKQFKPIASDSIERNNALTEQIETNVKNDLESEFEEISRLMKKNVPDLERIYPTVDCNWKNLVKFNLDLKFNSETHNIPLSNKGTGFKRLLMVAYFEYLANKNSGEQKIFGVEEPETFLHPALQFDLLESIIELSEEGQFFITTHSPVFAGATTTSNIVIVKKNGDRSEYSNHANVDDILNDVISELGIRPNYNLLNDGYRKIVFVEGKGDCLFWEEAIRKITGDLPNDILFLPCGGSQVEFFVNAQLCRRLNRNFMLLIDKDLGAVDYAAKQANNLQLQQSVEAMGGVFEILRKREIENYYNIDAITRIINGQIQIPGDFTINDYNDVQQEIKDKFLTPNRGFNFKSKNNHNVFTEMTRDEWIASAVQENGSTDIELIIERIME